MQNLGDELTKRLNDEIALAAVFTANNARLSIRQGNKTGNTYTEIFRTINGRVVPVGPRSGNNLSASHKASAPGEAPATDTGNLADNITQERQKTASRIHTFIVGTRVNYAKWLEFGTRMMAARPFMAPALRKERPEFMKRVANLPGGRRVRLNALMKEE